MSYLATCALQYVGNIEILMLANTKLNKGESLKLQKLLISFFFFD